MLSNGFKFTYLAASNADYIDQQFELFLKNPQLVEPSFRALFEGMELGHEFAAREFAEHSPVALSAAPAEGPSIDWEMEMKAVRLIQAYREFGRNLSDIDPLHPAPKNHPQLELQAFGLSTLDLSRPFLAASLIGLPARSTLEQLVSKLRSIYCGTIAFELEEVSNAPAREWLRSRIESQALRKPLTPAEKKQIFQRLIESESLERFLGLKFVAAKRFSIEGSEALIPALDEVLEVGAEMGLKEISIGMAHRGRLNVLVNTFGKKPEYLFTEFEGNYKIDPSEGEGDVKYHKGYSRDVLSRSGKTV
ncbi:MAG: 2-oxoglutarate dehydrogenase E1 component, partial [Betaproteobacteria bacterium]|nr:2-oxoglutarate dehydrogenase E1 component [Betaproteobacteria bacterium]